MVSLKTPWFASLLSARSKQFDPKKTLTFIIHPHAKNCNFKRGYFSTSHVTSFLALLVRSKEKPPKSKVCLSAGPAHFSGNKNREHETIHSPIWRGEIKLGEMTPRARKPHSPELLGSGTCEKPPKLPKNPLRGPLSEASSRLRLPFSKFPSVKFQWPPLFAWYFCCITRPDKLQNSPNFRGLSGPCFVGNRNNRNSTKRPRLFCIAKCTGKSKEKFADFRWASSAAKGNENIPRRSA